MCPCPRVLTSGLQSDYDVCVECGSLVECEHDHEGMTCPPPAQSVHALFQKERAGAKDDEADYLEMRTVRSIPPHSEVFNTYGLLSNAALLTRYGFVLPDNDFDTVNVVSGPLIPAVCRLLRPTKLGSDLTERPAVTDRVVVGDHLIRNNNGTDGEDGACGIGCGSSVDNKVQGTEHGRDGIDSDHGPGIDGEATRCSNTSQVREAPIEMDRPGFDAAKRLVCVFSRLARVWNEDVAWDEHDGGLVYNPDGLYQVTLKIDEGGDEEIRLTHGLVVNADGKLSHNLWLLCILAAVFSSSPSLDHHLWASLSRVENEGDRLTDDVLDDVKTRLIQVQKLVEALYHECEDEEVEFGYQEKDDRQRDSPPYLSLHHRTRVPTVCGAAGDYHDASARSSERNEVGLASRLGCAPTYSCGPSDQRRRGPSLAPSSLIPMSATLTDSRAPTMERTGFECSTIAGATRASLPCSPPAVSCVAERPMYLTAHTDGSPSLSDTRSATLPLPRTTLGDPPRDSETKAPQDPELIMRREEDEERPTKRIRRLSDILGMCADRLAPDELDAGKKGARAAEGAEGMERLSPPLSCRDDEDSGKRHGGIPRAGASRRLALQLARVVVGLCEGRCYPPRVERDRHGFGANAAELGEILDVSGAAVMLSYILPRASMFCLYRRGLLLGWSFFDGGHRGRRGWECHVGQVLCPRRVRTSCLPRWTGDFSFPFLSFLFVVPPRGRVIGPSSVPRRKHKTGGRKGGY